MSNVFLGILLIFAFGVGLYIFAIVQIRKFRRSQSQGK